MSISHFLHMKKSARCDNMASLGFSRKRSHDDLDDGDECLPISKRIHSLHIEGQSSGRLQDECSSVLIGNQQNVFPSISSSHSGFQPVDLIPGSPDNRSAIVPQPRQFAAQRLPRIDEQDYQPMQENEYGNLEQQNTRPTYLSTPTHSHISYAGQVQSNACDSVLNSHNQNGFSTYTHQTASHSQFSLSPSLCGLQPPQHQPHNHYGEDSSLPHVGHPAFISSHLSNTVDPGEARQEIRYSHTIGAAPNHLNPQQQSEYGYLTNCIGQESDSNHCSESRHCGEESPSDCVPNFQRDQLPSGNYEPELGMAENPFYFSVNQLLYEAHVSRVRRLNQFPD